MAALRLLVYLILFCTCQFAHADSKVDDSEERNKDKNPRTLLWKVSRPGISKPSYLLGINHIVSADWLYGFPEIKAVIESADLLMTEFYGDNETAIFGNTKEAEIKNRAKVNVRAVDLMTPDQFKTLDSFFVARVGEGITNNQEALEMNVWEMSSAVIMTLLSDKSGQGVTLPCMDRELFGIFKNKQKSVIALDLIENIEFGEDDKERAKAILSKFVEASKLGDYPGWNIADTSQTTGKLVYDYKMMNWDYNLNQRDPEDQSLIGSHTMAQRNVSWLPAIESGMGKNSCLIAVGALHLCYKTGLVTLLRKKGYKVEPVLIDNP